MLLVWIHFFELDDFCSYGFVHLLVDFEFIVSLSYEFSETKARGATMVFRLIDGRLSYLLFSQPVLILSFEQLVILIVHDHLTTIFKSLTFYKFSVRIFLELVYGLNQIHIMWKHEVLRDLDCIQLLLGCLLPSFRKLTG